MVEHWCIVLLLISRVTTENFLPLDLYIGTGGEFLGAGNLPLGVQSPYCTARLGPDTNDAEDSPPILNRYAGYHYSDAYITIFSHTHVFGAGIVDYGEVGIFSVQVDNDDDLQKMIVTKHGYRSTFKHENEQVEPGFYQACLDTHRIKVELIDNKQVGVHQYSFDNSNKTHRVILIDNSYTLPSGVYQQSHVNIDPTKNEINDSIFFQGSLSKFLGGLVTYFVITFTNWTNFGIWTSDHLAHGQTTAVSCSADAYIILPTNQRQVTIYVGISFVSTEQARTNLQIRTKLQSFDSIRELLQQKWLNQMSRFEACTV